MGDDQGGPDVTRGSGRGGEPMKKRLLRIALYLAVVGALCGLALEIAARLWFGQPVLTLRDWRAAHVYLLQTGGAAYDPLLGWTQQSNFAGGGFNTLDYGIRRNAAGDRLVQGAILAVGDSYTAGSEVVDEDTWPAQLEKLLRRRVINAGVGGYGVDQSVLNAERLLPILNPKVVIVGIYDEDVLRVRYKDFNAPKPYFVRENGQWIHRNNPVPTRSEPVAEPLYKTVLSRSLVAHMLAQRRFYWWYGPRFQQVSDTPVETSCHMLRRLQDQLAPRGITSVAVFQYSGWAYARRRPRPDYMQAVARCARDLGYEVVDEFDHVAALAQTSLEPLKQLYVMSPEGNHGHMSAKGNALIAGLLAERLNGVAQVAAAAALDAAPDAGGAGRR
jgi:hypothetical protein